MKNRQVSQPQDAFKALSDPTRRDILTLLRKRPDCSAGEIADPFPNISRPAVSRHLRLLREAGLATATGVGREQRDTLSLARLARVHHDWFAQFDARSTVAHTIQTAAGFDSHLLAPIVCAAAGAQAPP